MRIKSKLLGTLICSFMLMIIMFGTIQISGPGVYANIEQTDDDSPITPLKNSTAIVADGLTQTDNGDYIYIKDNASRFNISETIVSKSPAVSSSQDSLLDIDDDDYVQEVPDGWDFNKDFLNITGVYKKWEILKDNNVTYYNDGSDPVWYFEAFPDGPNGDNFYFTGTMEDGDLKIESDGVKYAGIIRQNDFAQWTQVQGKPDPDLSIYETEFVSPGQDKYPLIDYLDEDPALDDTNNWTKLEDNPYGGEDGSRAITMEWSSAGDGYLKIEIGAASNGLQLGNPSRAWSTNFSWDAMFVPKNVYIQFEWSVDNLGYEAADNISIIARVDDRYIDGRWDANGNYYANATATTLETDDVPEEIESHGIIKRAYRVTDLLTPGTNQHHVDFGVWMKNPDETDDDVLVRLHSIIVYAVEEEQYKIGDLFFHAQSGFSTTGDMKDWLMYAYFSNGSKSTAIFEPIGWLDDLFAIESSRDFHINLTTRLMPILNSSTIEFSLGIRYMGDDKLYTKDFFFKFDDVSLKPIYEALDYDKIGLQRWNGVGWEDVSVREMYLYGPYSELTHKFTLKFQVLNEDYKGSTMEFKSSIFMERMRVDAAPAMYIINMSRLGFIEWNVTYNNSDTVEQIIGNMSDYENFEPIAYNITYVDIPAWDNKGFNSTDWDPVGGTDPLNDPDPSYMGPAVRSNGTGGNSMTQNLTLVDPISEYWGGYINGTWTIIFHSANYLQNLTVRDSSNPDNVLDKIYAYNDTLIYVNRSSFPYGSPAVGSYNLTIFNDSLSQLEQTNVQYQQYHEGVSGNLTEQWTVLDEGVGAYHVLAIWNDTASAGLPTTRVGAWYYIVDFWRNSSATLLEEPPQLDIGEVATFKFNFSNEVYGPITGASSYVELYRNRTNRLWGTDWPPYVYLVQSVTEDTSTTDTLGNYTLVAKTGTVPTGEYCVYIKISMPYYDPQVLFSWINITGADMCVEIISGLYNDTGDYYLPEDNLPFVGDQEGSVIQLNVTNATGAPVSGAIISGTFNGTDNVFYGFELFTQTQNPDDRGIYNLTLDAKDLNSTLRPEFFNYTLAITLSKDGFDPFSFNVSVEVLPTPTELEANELPEVYEGGSFEFYVTYTNILGDALRDASVNWYIKNATTEAIIAQGSCVHILGGMYRADVVLETDDYYVDPGLYIFQVNASQLNNADAIWMRSNFTVHAKDDTRLKLKIGPQVRIGFELSVTVNLSYYNATAIPATEVKIDLTFGKDTFTVYKTTDANGIAVYTQIIPFNYANQNLTIVAEFAGNSTTHGSSANYTTVIAGKLHTNVSLSYTSMRRVGYEVNITGSLYIEEYEDYTGIYVTLAAWYDGKQDEPLFIKLMACDENGTISYTIDEIQDGYKNLTLYIDYAGSNTQEYSSDMITFDILPKWTLNILQNETYDEIRNGQTISLTFIASFDNSSCPEDILGLKLFITVKFASHEVFSYSEVFGLNNSISISITIPIDAGDNMTVSYKFHGTSKIAAFNGKITFDLLPQLKTSLEVITPLHIQGFSGDYVFSVRLTDELGDPMVDQPIVFEIVQVDKDGETVIKSIANKTAVTNEEGIATLTYTFDEVGYYSVRVYYKGESIYSASAYSSKIIVEVDNYWTIIEKNYDIILIALASAAAFGALVRQYYVLPKRERRKQALMEIHRRFADVENVQYMLIIHKHNGMSFFSWAFTEIPIDETLISGFLSAIGSFGEEIGEKVAKGAAQSQISKKEEGKYAAPGGGSGNKDDGSGKGLEELAYKQFKIALIEGSYIKTAVLLLKKPSDSLKEKIKKFNSALEEKYEDTLANWNGKVPDPQPILRLVEQYLYADLLYPHTVVERKVPAYIKKVGKKSLHARILEDALKDFDGRFYVREMINHMTAYGKNEIETFNALEDLRRDNIVFAINPRTQYLIDQFAPLIKRLTPEEITILKRAQKGLGSISGIANELKIPEEKVKSLIEGLIVVGYLDESLKLTQEGDALVTIMMLMPDLD